MSISLSKSRSSGFKLLFPIVPSSKDISDLDPFFINIMSTILPSIKINSLEMPWLGGQVYQEGGGIEYNQWETTFHIDESWNNYLLLYNWITSTYNGVNIFGSLTNDYQVTANLLILDNWNQTVITWQFKKLWPTSLSDVELSYENGNEILKCNVTFLYDYFYKI